MSKEEEILDQDFLSYYSKYILALGKELRDAGVGNMDAAGGNFKARIKERELEEDQHKEKEDLDLDPEDFEAALSNALINLVAEEYDNLIDKEENPDDPDYDEVDDQELEQFEGITPDMLGMLKKAVGKKTGRSRYTGYGAHINNGRLLAAIRVVRGGVGGFVNTMRMKIEKQRSIGQMIDNETDLNKVEALVNSLGQASNTVFTTTKDRIKQRQALKQQQKDQSPDKDNEQSKEASIGSILSDMATESLSLLLPDGWREQLAKEAAHAQGREKETPKREEPKEEKAPEPEKPKAEPPPKQEEQKEKEPEKPKKQKEKEPKPKKPKEKSKALSIEKTLQKKEGTYKPVSTGYNKKKMEKFKSKKDDVDIRSYYDRKGKK